MNNPNPIQQIPFKITTNIGNGVNPHQGVDFPAGNYVPEFSQALVELASKNSKARGEVEGFSRGLARGKKISYDKGFEKGVKQGKLEGRKVGYTAGNREGESQVSNRFNTRMAKVLGIAAGAGVFVALSGSVMGSDLVEMGRDLIARNVSQLDANTVTTLVKSAYVLAGYTMGYLAGKAGIQNLALSLIDNVFSFKPPLFLLKTALNLGLFLLKLPFKIAIGVIKLVVNVITKILTAPFKFAINHPYMFVALVGSGALFAYLNPALVSALYAQGTTYLANAKEYANAIDYGYYTELLKDLYEDTLMPYVQPVYEQASPYVASAASYARETFEPLGRNAGEFIGEKVGNLIAPYIQPDYSGLVAV